MGVEGRDSNLSRQNSDEELKSASPATASSELRRRFGLSGSDSEQGPTRSETAALRASQGNDQVAEGLGERGDAMPRSWFQRLDENFLSPLFLISSVERERQNMIVSSFQSECAYVATGNQGSVTATRLLCGSVTLRQVRVAERVDGRGDGCRAAWSRVNVSEGFILHNFPRQRPK